jgi:hypothetical protein
MAKVAFTKLGLKVNQEVRVIEWNEQKIEVKQYLPINEKLELISNVINLAHDGKNNYSNPVRVDVYTALEVIDAYTNINFTEKQREDPTKIYDLFHGNGLFTAIIEAIPEAEYVSVINGIYRSIDAIYTYHNSVLGILDAVSTDYENIDLDLSQLQEAIGNPENIGLLRNVLDKLG